MANLIVCCDGTWNTDDQTDGNGLPIPTNVAKLYNALDRTPGNEQRSYYHPGVGTYSSWIANKWGGITGAGLRENVKSAYRWIAKNYEQGDNIFLFGFSRGAYTARAAAGMIVRCGLVNLAAVDTSEASVRAVINAVFDADEAGRPRPYGREKYFDWPQSETAPQTPIHFVGVWDTVGSLGVPADVPVISWLTRRWRAQFHNQILSPKVRNARHAMALDEHRANFMPTFWEPSPPGSGNSLIQLWFPGVHADVGGGYGECGLSDGALQWMIDEATACGAKFHQPTVNLIKPDAMGAQHASDTGVFARLKTRMRSVPFVASQNAACFHPSVMQRYGLPPLDHGPYWPGRTLNVGQSVTFEILARKTWNYTGLYLEAAGRYTFEARGEWTDDKITSGPDGRGRNACLSQFWRGVFTWLPTKIQRLCRLTEFGQDYNIWLSARYEKARFFSLIGSLANGIDGNATGNRQDETFEIGNQLVDYKVGRDGYFYAYANDAWSYYYNNHGSVSLTITRVG